MAKIGFNQAFEDNFEKDLQRLLKLFKEIGVEARELNQAVKSAKTFEQMQANAKKAAEGVNKLTDSEKKLLAAEKRLKFESSEAGKQRAKLNEQTRRATAENKKYAQSQLQAVKSTNRFGSAIKSFLFKANFLANVMSNLVSVAIRAFSRAAKQAVTIVKNFDKSTARLASVIGKTRKEIAGLTKQAKQLGSITQFTATQVTGLQIELAKLGFEADQISAATPGILSFATATGADLAAAAKTAGAAVRIFGLSALETEDAVATLAVATTKSGLTFEHYDTILSTVGPVAKAYGFTLADVVALTGELASKGFEANKAATATRNILLNLADANGALAKKLGGAATSFDGLIDGLIEADKAGVDLGEALQLTDKRSVAAFSTFLEGAESARTLRDGITDVKDELQAMVDVQLDTLAGDMDLLKSAWEGFILAVSDGGILREAVQLLTNAVLQVSNLDLAVRKFHKQNQEQIARSFQLLSSLTNRQGTAFQAVIDQFEETSLAEIILNEDDVVAQFAKVRKVNKKEAKALFDEFVRQRQIAAEEEIKIEINKQQRLAKEREKAANKTKTTLEDVSEQLKQLKKDETESFIEDDQEYIDENSKAWDIIAENTKGAFKFLEELEQSKHDDRMQKLQDEREAEDEALKQRIAAEQMLKNIQLDIANESFNIVSAFLDRKQARIDQQLKDGIISEEQAAEESTKLQKKAAVLHKSQALFNIAISTAEGVAAALKTPLLIPFIIGLGAAQAAVVLATPLPQFAKGTESSPRGGAIVGEKGSELMIDPSGQMSLTPDVASFTDLEKGTRIVPADITSQIMKYAAVATGMGSKANKDSLILEMMRNLNDSNERLRREVKNKPVIGSTMTAAGILTSIHKGNTVIKKMQKYFS